MNDAIILFIDILFKAMDKYFFRYSSVYPEDKIDDLIDWNFPHVILYYAIELCDE